MYLWHLRIFRNPATLDRLLSSAYRSRDSSRAKPRRESGVELNPVTSAGVDGALGFSALPRGSWGPRRIGEGRWERLEIGERMEMVAWEGGVEARATGAVGVLEGILIGQGAGELSGAAIGHATWGEGRVSGERPH